MFIGMGPSLGRTIAVINTTMTTMMTEEGHVRISYN